MPITRLCLPLIILLTACTPHPGAGGWRATSGDAAFERLEIRYNGQADFYIRTEDITAAWRCFWGTGGENKVSMKCVDAGNANNEQEFVFMVEQGRKLGSLLQGRETLGVYEWQPPTAVSSE